MVIFSGNVSPVVVARVDANTRRCDGGIITTMSIVYIEIVKYIVNMKSYIVSTSINSFMDVGV